MYRKASLSELRPPHDIAPEKAEALQKEIDGLRKELGDSQAKYEVANAERDDALAFLADMEDRYHILDAIPPEQ